MERKSNEQSSFKSACFAAVAALLLAVTATGCATAPDDGSMLHVDQGTGTD